MDIDARDFVNAHAAIDTAEQSREKSADARAVGATPYRYDRKSVHTIVFSPLFCSFYAHV
jgi:hypothetical protein